MRWEVSLGYHLHYLLGHNGPNHTRCGVEVQIESSIEFLQDLLEVDILN